MKSTRKITSIILLILLGVTAYGLVRTGNQLSVAPGNGAAPGITLEQSTAVDQAPLVTAQNLAHTPTSAAELPFAQGALVLGDHEMDLSFALAVLDATQHPPTLSPDAKDIQSRLQKAEDDLAAEQSLIAQLTAAGGKATGAQKETLDDNIELAKAQLELRQDEVDDAKQDLMRAGGDPQGRIQAMVQDHEAASHNSDVTKVDVSATIEPHGLVQRFQQWSVMHQKQLQLWRAKQDARSEVTALTNRHNSLGEQIEPQKIAPMNPTASGSGAALPVAADNSDGSSRQAAAAMLKSTKIRANDRKTLSTLDERIANENQLANLYGQWISVIASQQEVLVNRGLRGIVIILVIAIIALFFDDWIVSLLGKTSLDPRQMKTLRSVTRVTLQILGVLLILLVIFGPPNQLGTFLGLAGAGLTVALQDFIIAFFGRFVLMGRNGIRLGDWVEINGVTGEVVELGFFHTVLLETGNWTESGYPTGRRVTFTNSFAIEGHYFNFSTSGQWLWDELQIVLPAGQDPYPAVDAIKKEVVEATSESVRQAEQEWQGDAKSGGVTPLSAAPSINVKPVIGGTAISVRYITCANERSQLREKLNRAAVDLLGSGATRKTIPDSEKPALTSS